MNDPSNSQLAERYRLLAQIGQGGMGSVYRAYDRLTGQMIALKQVNVHPTDLQFTSRGAGSNTHDAMLSLALEFRTLAGLRHPNIVEVLDYGFVAAPTEDARLPFFTMRLIEEAQTVTDYEADERQKIRLVIEILQALAYLHRRGIIHRDLKPGNVLVTKDGQVKVMDFGLALHQSQSVSDAYGNAVGTLAYMAPELFEDQSASEQSDLYSLGVIAYELLAGQHPFKSRNVATLLTNIMMRKPDTAFLPPELAAILDKLLSKTPAERYESAEAVILALCEATGQPPPTENSALRESFLQAAKFVGRDEEMTALSDALQALLRPNPAGSAYLIGGESGVGKSRLLDELRILAMVEGVTVLRGQGVTDGGLPFQLWRDPVRRLVLSTPLTDLEAGVLKEIVPDIGELLGKTVPDAPRVSGPAGQQRLTSTIVQVFRRYCESGHPTLLILEDLQWALESVEVLKALYRAVKETPLMLVGSYRDEERASLPDELPGMQVLPLKRLTPEMIAKLGEAMLGEAGRKPHVVELLQRETEGNVFFLVEVARVLAEDAGRISDIGEKTLPQKIFAGGVQQVIERRLSRVPDEERELLGLAAVSGRQLDLKVLGEMLPEPLDHWLSVCAGAAVLEVMDDQWRFTHDKIREYLLSQLNHAERPLLHRKVAEALERVYPDDQAYAGILVEHWHHAGEPAREAHYALIAGEQLVRISQYRAACTLAERCMAQRGVDHLYVRLACMLGDAVIRLGDFARAEQVYHEALKRVATPSEKMMVFSGLSQLHWRTGRYDSAWQFSQQSLELAQTEHAEQTIAQNYNDFGAISFYQGNYAAAETYYAQALTIHERLGNRHGVAVCLGNLASVARSLGNLKVAEEYNQQSMETYQEVGDRQGMAVVLSNQGIISALQGDLQMSKGYFEQSLAIHQEVGDRRSVALELNNLGSVAIYLEDYSSAAEYLRESLDLHQEIGDKRGTALALINLTLAYTRLRDFHQARRYLQLGLEVATSIQAVPMRLGLLISAVELFFMQGSAGQAARWAGLAHAHPATEQESRGELEKLLPQLKAVLGEQTLEAFMKEGQGLDLDDVTERLIGELAS